MQVGDRFQDLPEAPGTIHQGTDHRAVPALAHQLDRPMEARAHMLFIFVSDSRFAH